MPAARPSSFKSRKSKTSNPHFASHSPSKSPSSRTNETKHVTCRAWWCDSTFSRRADMLKHVGSEHFGKRAYCTVCGVVMKQDSNMSTHLNAHLKNRCTLCSCGRSFTDPSACTRHREATGHEKGSTHGKIRPTTIKPVKIQHLAGLSLDFEMISDPNFIPPPFDESFHLKGMPKQKAQEKYDSNNYVTIGSGVPNIPSTQMTEILLINGAPAAEYQESVQIERRAPAHTEIQMDKLGLNVDFSYDVELPREPRYSRGISQNPYTECHGSSIAHNRCHQLPFDGYYTPPDANPLHHSYPAAAPYITTDANFYPQQYPENYPMAVTDHFPAPPQPVAEPHPSPVPIPQASLDMPPHHDSFGETGFIIPEPFEQPQYQYFYHPNDYFNYVYQPALATY